MYIFLFSFLSLILFRRFFYYRLLRRIQEESLKKQIVQASPNLSGSNQQLIQLIQQWVLSSNNSYNSESWEDDHQIIQWFEQQSSHIQKKLKELRSQYVNQKILQLSQEDKDTALATLLNVLVKEMSPEQKLLAIKALQQK